MTKLAETLMKLVEIPSVTGNEGRLVTAIAERLLPIYTMAAARRVGNSLIVGQPTGRRPLVSLFGHTDTVPDQGNGSARIEGGRLYGLGSSDMKAGLAVMIHLLEEDSIRAGEYDVVGVFFDKEEGPAADNGLGPVLDHASWVADSELGIVLEPTDLRIELGCNGFINADVVFHGSSAHSARPWLGDNAITKAGAWLHELHEREPEAVEIGGLEYVEVFSVTRADGGIATNVIPSRFSMNLNYRFPPTYELDEAESRMRRIAGPADEIEIRDAAPAGKVPDGNAHLTRFEQLTRAERAAKQAWTDVARLTAIGVDAVNYGPGEVAEAHQVGESVALGNLDIAFEALREFLKG